MATKLTIDEDECIGCESCVEICPDAFEFVEDSGKAIVKDTATGDEDCVDEAIASCPTECIHNDE